MQQLPKLKELALDGNPCSTSVEFNYELIVRCPKLKSLNDDEVRPGDREVANEIIEMKGIPKPSLVSTEKKEKVKKSVSFKESQENVTPD
jgi:hypothetical protein